MVSKNIKNGHRTMEEITAANDRQYLSQRLNVGKRVEFMYDWQPLQHLVQHIQHRHKKCIPM